MNNKLLLNIARICGAFAVVLSILIVVNFVQTLRVDPLNTKAMNALNERLKDNPNDENLRQEIRELDLLARKAFFTNQWQVRTGGYLLLISVLIIVICLKTIEMNRAKLPEIPSDKTISFWDTAKLGRKWVIYAGIFWIVLSLTLAFVTNRRMSVAQDSAKKELASKKDSLQNKTANTLSTDTSKTQQTDTASTGKANEKAPTYQELIKNVPSFRGYGGLGISYAKGVPTSWDGASGKNIKWKATIPLQGYNSPVVWNDKVFLAGATATQREVYCFDVETGKLLWTAKIGTSSAASPKVSNDTGFSAPTLTTDGRWVFAIFSNGDLACIDMEGKTVWFKNIGVPQNHYGHSSSLIMNGDLVIVQFDQRSGGVVMAFQAKTGNQVWKTSRDVKISWASPVLAYTGKRSELILTAEPFVISYNPNTGKELWRVNCMSGEVGPSVAYTNGIVFAVNEYAKLAAIQISETPSVIWEDTEYLSDIPSPVAYGDLLFMATSYGTVVCYDAKTGTKHWTQEYGTSIIGSPMVVEGKVYLLLKTGKMVIIGASKTYSVIGSGSLGEESVCTSAFVDGKIFIRGMKNLYCIGK